MEVKIGVQHASRELVLDSSESADAVEQVVAKALSSDTGVLALSDVRGRKVLVPIQKLAYVEIGTATASQVGFRS